MSTRRKVQRAMNASQPTRAEWEHRARLLSARLTMAGEALTQAQAANESLRQTNAGLLERIRLLEGSCAGAGQEGATIEPTSSADKSDQHGQPSATGEGRASPVAPVSPDKPKRKFPSGAQKRKAAAARAAAQAAEPMTVKEFLDREG